MEILSPPNVGGQPEDKSSKRYPKEIQNLKQIGIQSLKSFINGFALAYGIRTGISVVLRAIHLLRTNPSSLFSFQQLLSEKNLIVRVDAVRLGFLIGGFTGGYDLISSILRKYGFDERWSSFIGGSFAGLSLIFQEKENRRNLSLYLFVRLLQCLYNASKVRGWWHFWGSHWAHGDSLLFVLTSAQVMYAYVMRPDSIPMSYWKFIVRTGPIAATVLEAVKNNNRGKPIDVPKIMEYCRKTSNGKMIPKIGEFPSIIPCSVLHPKHPSCTRNNLSIFIKTTKKIFPLYATLTFVPMVLLKLKGFIRSPLRMIWNGLFGTFRSTVFLASFVSLYQLVICLHRKVSSKDQRFIYFFAGIVSSLSILFEKKGRRSELALYVLPRALDSWYIQLYEKKWLGSVPGGELILFCLSMGGLMYFFHNEPDTMSSALHWLIKVSFRARII